MSHYRTMRRKGLDLTIERHHGGYTISAIIGNCREHKTYILYDSLAECIADFVAEFAGKA